MKPPSAGGSRCTPDLEDDAREMVREIDAMIRERYRQLMVDLNAHYLTGYRIPPASDGER